MTHPHTGIIAALSVEPGPSSGAFTPVRVVSSETRRLITAAVEERYVDACRELYRHERRLSGLPSDDDYRTVLARYDAWTVARMEWNQWKAANP